MTLNYAELVARARAQIREVTTEEVAARLDAPPVILDVREPGEVRFGTIPGAVFLPLGSLEAGVAAALPDREAEIVVICAAGNRSALAALMMQQMGYRAVASMAGGLGVWRRQGHPMVVPGGLVDHGFARYERHLVLPGVGEAGQARLAQSRVLVLGAGGLGSPVALYLAAAGVGTLGVVDADTVELGNLQRQVVHDTPRLGERKVDSAAEAIGNLNPDVEVVRYPVRLIAGNARDILDGYDVVVDGTDNFPTRYLVNDAALHLRVPVVHGSVLRWEGQVTVFDPYRGPCYRCLFPQPPPPEFAPDCAEAGVLGALPGVIGSIQATEALKLLLGVGESLTGRLLVYDALGCEFTTLSFDRDPTCPACADEENPPALVDYDDACKYAGAERRWG
ncbi:MAG: molybdopterin biosynthesis protein MoeB [Actinobacteria bacterium RBG_16_68_21]|nr:MAG: molybdopterin biosynthesis protein MoeB [Actinobacteria bacterium RBG_16_68_21]